MLPRFPAERRMPASCDDSFEKCKIFSVIYEQRQYQIYEKSWQFNPCFRGRFPSSLTAKLKYWKRLAASCLKTMATCVLTIQWRLYIFHNQQKCRLKIVLLKWGITYVDPASGDSSDAKDKAGLFRIKKRTLITLNEIMPTTEVVGPGQKTEYKFGFKARGWDHVGRIK